MSQASSSSPGERALSVLKSDTAIFKIPQTFSRTKRKRKVLTEEIYLEEMGKIIERDFFPDMKKLRAQNEYLDALSENDTERMRQIYSMYSSGKRPPTERVASPATFETPAAPDRESDPLEKATEPPPDGKPAENKTETTKEHKLSLDQYLNVHSSEDNESFVEIQKESEKKHKLKYGWLYKDEAAINSGDKLSVPSIENQAAGYERPLELDTWTYKNHNFIMYVPEGMEMTPEEELAAATKKNVIVHENTNLIKNPFDEKQNKQTIQELALSQARSQEGRIGVDGKVVTQAQTPTINGFSLVRTPSPQPGVNESPLMTWGEIEGTPFRLDGGDTPYVASTGPTFRIPELPKRERLAMALADKASEGYRDRKRKAIQVARSQLVISTPRRSGSSQSRLNEMSPAAQRLASVSLQRKGTDSALRESYSPRRPGSSTPKPSPRNSTTPSPLVSPARSPHIKKIVRRPTPINITDDLLMLPRSSYNRPRASDFF